MDILTFMVIYAILAEDSKRLIRRNFVMSIFWERSYFKELEQAKKEGWPILLPVGTIEYHSTHCPYGCDALMAQGVAHRVAEEIDTVVMPTIWYGVSSYAVGGPETNTIHVDCDVLEDYVYSILKSLFKSGFNKNIYLLIAHQTEDYNPMALACMKAARKLVFEYLEETGGYGWWGRNDCKDFYENLQGKDNPWNWVRILNLSNSLLIPGLGDCGHADKNECAWLEALYPGSIKLERLADTDDWFAADAAQMDVEDGKKQIKAITDFLVKMMSN